MADHWGLVKDHNYVFLWNPSLRNLSSRFPTTTIPSFLLATSTVLVVLCNLSSLTTALAFISSLFPSISTETEDKTQIWSVLSIIFPNSNSYDLPFVVLTIPELVPLLPYIIF